MFLLIVAAITLMPAATEAQAAGKYEFRVGIGTFLTRDRGWNYAEPVELFAALARTSGSIDLEAGASFSKSFVRFSKPAVFPPPPSGYRDGFRARVGLRVPSLTHSSLSALVGTELVHNRTDGEVGTTIAATGGIGLNFGPARRATLDLRYVSFARRLGSSRGILPFTLAWRL
jgi:hypothetical protein